MVVHIRKLAAGVEDIEELESIHAQRLADSQAKGMDGFLYTYTRNSPKRQKELLEEGGSIYWVIKGQFRVRQEIIGFEAEVDEEGRKYCLIILKPGLIRTELKAQKPFQGWRYFLETDVPRDLDPSQIVEQDLPDDMAEELRGLGLL